MLSFKLVFYFVEHTKLVETNTNFKIVLKLKCTISIKLQNRMRLR